MSFWKALGLGWKGPEKCCSFQSKRGCSKIGLKRYFCASFANNTVVRLSLEECSQQGGLLWSKMVLEQRFLKNACSSSWQKKNMVRTSDRRRFKSLSVDFVWLPTRWTFWTRMVLEQRFLKNACSSSWQKKTHGLNVGSKEIKKFLCRLCLAAHKVDFLNKNGSRVAL